MVSLRRHWPVLLCVPDTCLHHCHYGNLSPDWRTSAMENPMTRHPLIEHDWHQKTCERCGKGFSVKQNRPSRGRFCSRSCYDLSRRQKMEDLSIEILFDNCMTVPESGCWLWVGKEGDSSIDYPRIRVDGKHLAVDRVIWILKNGSHPAAGMFVCHKCDVPMCVNPDHLFIGTHTDNVRDMHKKKRWKARDMRGENSPTAKLTNEDVTAIRQSTESNSVLAARYGVVRDHIQRVKDRKMWKNIP